MVQVSRIVHRPWKYSLKPQDKDLVEGDIETLQARDFIN